MSIKYVGSKSRLVDEILKRMPEGTTHIVEPFCGSAAFSLSQPLNCTLMDSSPELVNFLRCVKEHPQELIQEVIELDKVVVDKESFIELRMRDQDPEFLNQSTISRAARYYIIIYKGFNGLYRVNKKGFNNTPYGGTLGGKARSLPQDFENSLREDSDQLKMYCSDILECQFDNLQLLKMLKASGVKTFVLIDPPYYGTFNQYVKDRPDPAFWERLKVYLTYLKEMGIPFLMTNSDDPFIIEMFDAFTIEKVGVKYTVAADGKKRGIKFESFITK